MSFVKIYLHVVWATKKREPFLKKSIRPILFQHILQNAREKGIYVDFINGVEDHVHCLISLRPTQNIANVIQLIKGESSFWTNKVELIPEKLTWAEEYFAVSVSQSQIESVRNYIKNQEEHHKKKSFQMECDEFIEKYGFPIADLPLEFKE
jgi:putative transposase